MKTVRFYTLLMVFSASGLLATLKLHDVPVPPSYPPPPPCLPADPGCGLDAAGSQLPIVIDLGK
jgi:hypothetical protein